MILLSAQVSITHIKLSNDAFLFWFQMILTGKILLSILTCEKVKCHKKEDMLWMRYSFSHINHAWLLYEEKKIVFVNPSTKILKYHADVWEGRSATIWWYRDGYNHDKKRNSNPILSLFCMFGASLLLNFLLVDVRIVCPVWIFLLFWLLPQVHLYENLLSGCEMVESQYVYNL
jgi:hypothetical protein